MVTIVFNAGAEALDLEPEARVELAERIIYQLRMIVRGGDFYHKSHG